MGKGLRHRDSSFTRESSSPGCMFGILHHLNHQQHRWHQVRKRLPHIRQAGGKHIAAAGDHGSNATATDSANIPEKVDVKSDDSHTVVKTAGSQPKNSIKSRLKTMITKELLSRKRLQHRRSVSCPTRMPLEQAAPNVDPSPKIRLNDETLQHPQNEYSSVASLLDPPLPKKRKDVVTNNTCELCAAMLDMNHLMQCDTNKNGKQPITNFTLRRTQSLYFREGTKNASIEESKLFLDALDLLNMREELFLKILQGPNSSLAHQLHGTHASKGLTKSVSFPSCLSLGKIARSTGKLNSHLVRSTNLSSKEEVGKGVLKRLESFANVPPSSPGGKHKRHDSKLVLARFRNLKDKITHALKESRKEKRRIIMDGVLHRVPKDVKKGNNLLEPNAAGHDRYFPESSCNTAHHHSPFSKNQTKSFKRTSSLNDSLDRYNILLDQSCVSRDEKQQSSESSSLRASRSPSPARSRPIVLERILSLPDLRHYPSFRIEDAPEASYSETVNKAASTASSKNLNLGANRCDEQKSLDIPLGSEKKTQQDSSSDSKSSEDLLDVSENSDDVGGFKTENSFPVEYNKEDNSSPKSTLDKPILISFPDVITQEDANAPEELSTTEGMENAFDDGILTNEEGTLADEQKRSLLHIHVEERNKAEFNYVKDVLDLSGFSGNGFMNLSVFEEVGGCFLSQPDCSGYGEENGSCDQLLLFDLINEVLLQLYERAYWPKALTSRSYIHPMLHVGYHLLEEVWKDISWWLSYKLENDQSLLDDAASRDLAKGDNWMNLQFDAECVGLELEDLIFDDLLDELVFIDVY